ncbi:cytochrome P450 [Streptomyces sp. A7024]|uniref:Cytochrome P450 n=1 Tax=Streptomyces coryli TaxID=1128680 RepID=A0A6G4UAH4_9ACTN|nr:cytochrome P450 [Streptomyces coryli]NGN69133.1 cytochrome P450 [Streptomyces coryli]
MTQERSKGVYVYPFAAGEHGSAPPVYEEMRGRCPMAEARLPSGDQVLMVTSYDDVRQVLSDPRFSRGLLLEPGAPRILAEGGDFGGHPEDLVNMDPPEHTRLRRILQPAFTVRRAEKWRGHIRGIAEELIDGVVAAGPPADLLDAFAFPLPVRVICRVLGVPADDVEQLRAWSDTMLSVTPAGGEERERSAVEFGTYVYGLVEAHRKQPVADPLGLPELPDLPDLLHDLIDAHDEGDRLSEMELIRTVCGLIVAGHETTANSIARGILTLLRHPEQLAALRADSGLLPGAVEEILRAEIPGHYGLLRMAREDVELPSGGVVPKGRGVLPSMAAANLDPAHFADPSALDIRRADSRHLAFGHGTHFCLGANLARVELQEALRAFLARLPDPALTVDPAELTWGTDSRVCRVSEVPVTWGR